MASRNNLPPPSFFQEIFISAAICFSQDARENVGCTIQCTAFFNWPHIVNDVYATARDCRSCTRNHRSNIENWSFHLFLSAEPLKSVVMDICGLIPKMVSGSQFNLVVTTAIQSQVSWYWLLTKLWHHLQRYLQTNEFRSLLFRRP